MKFTVTKTHYTVLPNRIINSPDMSFKAKGVLAYMLSRPDDWQFYLSEIVKHATDGMSAVRSAVQELIDNRYIVRIRDRDEETGKFAGYIYLVFDFPQEHPEIYEMKEDASVSR